MPQSIYSRSVSILTQFNASHGNNLRVLYEPGLANPWDLLAVNRYYGFITDLRMKVQIRSIPEKDLPELDVTQSRTERLTAVRDMEWSGERYEFGLFMETSRAPVLQIASVSLLNRKPYYHINLLPYFTDNAIVNIASDARIFGRVQDVGYGLLKAGDEIVIFGSVKEEFTTLPEEQRVIQFSQPSALTVGTSSLIALPANANRLQATLVNTSASARIFLNYGSTAQQNQGITLMPNGGTYEINTTNPYFGVISAISSTAGATLSILECL